MNYYEAALKRGNPIDVLGTYDGSSDFRMKVWSGEKDGNGKPVNVNHKSALEARKYVEENVLNVAGEVVVHAKEVTTPIEDRGEKVAWGVLVWSAPAKNVAYYAEVMRIVEEEDGTFIIKEVAVNRHLKTASTTNDIVPSGDRHQQRRLEQDVRVARDCTDSVVFGCLFVEALRDHTKADASKMETWFANAYQPDDPDDETFLIYYDHSSGSITTARTPAEVRTVYEEFFGLKDQMSAETWQTSIIGLPPNQDDYMVIADSGVQIWITMETRGTTVFQAPQGLPKQFQFLSRFDPTSSANKELTVSV